MGTAVRVAVIVALALPSYSATLHARGGGGQGKSNAEKCHTLLMKWRSADGSHHMRNVLNKRSKAEKKMRKLGCPPPGMA